MSDLVVAEQPRVPAIVAGVPWAEVLQVYLDRLSAAGTRRAYGAAVREAFSFWGFEYVNQVAPGDLARYRAHLVERVSKRRKGDVLSPASVALKLSALRGFFKFCRLTGVTEMSHEVIRFTLAGYAAKVVKPYQVLSEEEQRRLLAHADGRDYVLLKLMLATGLRAAEVTQLCRDDIIVDEDGDWCLWVRQGKGRKDRLVPLASWMRETLQQWLEVEKRMRYLFYGWRGKPLSTRRLQQIVATVAMRAGIGKEITPHSLRHTMAMRLLRSGASVVMVQKILGHASVQTTQKYLDHLDYQEIKKWAVEV
jgi:integrase/recombinase XerD